jgi:hypothetical protein
MRSFLISLPLKLQLAIIVFSTMAIALIIALLTSSLFDLQQLKTNTDLISSVYQVMGTIYAILLTFTLWGVWQNYTEANNSVQREANALLDLVHIVEASPRWSKYNISETASIYANWVVKTEWATLKIITNDDINIHERDHSASRKITQLIQSITPEDEREFTIFSQTLTLLNKWLDARRTRILIARGNSAQSLWPLLLTGAFVLFAYHGLFVAETLGIWVALLSGVSLVIGLTFYLIYTLDCPFAGYPCIDSEPFRLAMNLLNQHNKLRTPVDSITELQ